MLDATTYSRKLDEVVTLLVGGHPGTAVVRFNRLRSQVDGSISLEATEVALKMALSNRVGIIKVDKYWTNFSLAQQALAMKSVA